MKKLYQSFGQDAQNFQNKLNNYQEKVQGKFQGMLLKSEEKKQKIIQKLQYAKEQLQLSIENNNQKKSFKLQQKIDQLEIEMQKINRKDQIAKDYHLVYDGLLNQLQITQTQQIETLSQAQRNDNYKILCSIKRQAINLQSYVYKKKHIDPLIQICFHCNQSNICINCGTFSIKEYLKLGVDNQIQQEDIFQIDNVANQKLNEKEKFREEKWQQKQEEKQYLEDQQLQSQYKQKDGNKQQKKKERSNYSNERKLKQSQQEQLLEQNQQIQQEKGEQYSNLWNKLTKNKLKQQQQQQEIKQGQHIDLIQKFNNLKIEDKQQQNQIIQKQQKPQETEQATDDSKLCQICFEFPKEYVATPCGHFVYCSKCKDLAQKQCLICREPVQQLIKVFQ